MFDIISGKEILENIQKNFEKLFKSNRSAINEINLQLNNITDQKLLKNLKGKLYNQENLIEKKEILKGNNKKEYIDNTDNYQEFNSKSENNLIDQDENLSIIEFLEKSNLKLIENNFIESPTKSDFLSRNYDKEKISKCKNLFYKFFLVSLENQIISNGNYDSKIIIPNEFNTEEFYEENQKVNNEINSEKKINILNNINYEEEIIYSHSFEESNLNKSFEKNFSYLSNCIEKNKDTSDCLEVNLSNFELESEIKKNKFAILKNNSEYKLNLTKMTTNEFIQCVNKYSNKINMNNNLFKNSIIPNNSKNKIKKQIKSNKIPDISVNLSLTESLNGKNDNIKEELGDEVNN